MSLQELVNMGVKDILSFDVHNGAVQNAIPLASFENIYPTYNMVRSLVRTEPESVKNKNIVVIAPDTGAMDRAIYFAGVLEADIGVFYKRRDHATVVDGVNPIVAHEYLGPCLEGKDILVVDDLIATGTSLLDVVDEAKKRDAARVYLAATFGQFTKGVDNFDKYYKEGKLDRLFTTNLTYVPKEFKERPWFVDVDMSGFVAKLIDFYNHGMSLAPLLERSKQCKEMIARELASPRGDK